MEPSVWRLEGTRAELRLARLVAALDLLSPAHGLNNIHVDGQLLPHAQLLHVELPAIEPSLAKELVDAYARCGDLVATYAQTPSRPFRAQVYWRTASHAASDAAAAIELVASVQTSLLDSRPELVSGSRVPATEILHLQDADQCGFQPLDALASAPLRFDASRCSCFLFRLPGGISYAEMVHPLDARETTITTTPPAGDTPPCMDVRHRLFARELEKGVILRSRVLGLFVPRDDDTVVAAGHYRTFAATEPPLTT